MVARLLLRNGLFDEGRQLLVGAAALHDSVQVVVELRKKASANLAVGSQPDAAALPAEGSRYRRNDADLAQPVVEGIAHCRFSGGIGGQLHEIAPVERLPRRMEPPSRGSRGDLLPAA